MIAGRLRQCLKILRWKTAYLAEELGYPESEVAAWLDGRARAPLAVAAWLEALVKAYKALPRPCQNAPVLQPEEKGSKIAEIRLPAPVVARSMAQGHLPRHQNRAVFAHSPDVRHAAVGMGFPVTIENTMEAYALLQDWPEASRNGTHNIALNACRAAIAGEVEPETVRATLVAFARRNDLLVPNVISAASTASASRALRAG